MLCRQFFLQKEDKKKSSDWYDNWNVNGVDRICFSNLYLIIPFYAKLFGMTMQDIVAMCTEVNPKVTDAFTMVLLGIVPLI